MKGGVTQKDMEDRKRKAAALDDLREWLKGRADSEVVMEIKRRIETAYVEEVDWT